MAFQRSCALLDRISVEEDPRLYDDHVRFCGHWDKEQQLAPIVSKMGLSPNKEQSYADANFARTVVFNHKTRNTGTCYSRRMEWYNHRYNRTGDPYCTYRRMTGAANRLWADGYIDHIMGRPNRNRPYRGRESVAYPTQKLLDLIGDLVDPLEPRALPTRPEVIIKRGADKKNDDYSDTDETRAMSEEMWGFNDEFALREFCRQGQLVPVPPMRRVFHQRFDRGGRLYCHGESYQQLPGEQRAEIVEIVGGEPMPMAELDYPAHHFRLAYAWAGKEIPPGDPYCIPGFEDKRDLCKLGGLIAFNGDDMNASAYALVKESGCTYDEAFKVLKAVREKHHEIRYAFFSDTGAKLMRVDSDMTVTLMKRFREQAGYTPLPVHDSYIVRACDSEILGTLMEEVFEEYRARMQLAEQDETTHTSPPSIYGVTFFPHTSDQDPSDTDKDPTDQPLGTFTTAKEVPELTVKASKRHIYVGGPYPCQKRRGYVGIFPGEVWTALGRLSADWANGAPRDWAIVREWDKLVYGASELSETFTMFAPGGKAAAPTPHYRLNSFETREIAACRVHRNCGPVDPETEYWLFLGVLVEQYEEDALQPPCAQIGSDKLVQYARYIRRQERENAAAREKAKRKALREYLRECRAAGVKIERPKRGPKLTGDE